MAELAPDDLRLTALHEAGHAVVAVVLGLDLMSSDMIVNGEIQGTTRVSYVYNEVRGKGSKAVAPFLALAMAGAAAESLLSDKYIDISCHDDAYACGLLAAAAICDIERDQSGRAIDCSASVASKSSEISDLVAIAINSAFRLVRDNFDAIAETALAILANGSLSRQEIAAIVAKHSNPSGR